MPAAIQIENIEEMRRQLGIEDVELRIEIRTLKVGDLVHLTFLTGSGSFEVVPVQITHIRGATMRGKLAKRPTCAGLSKHASGTPIDFTTAHIHSVPRKGAEEDE